MYLKTKRTHYSWIILKIGRWNSDLEHKGDNITHEIITESRRTFLTPFDREILRHWHNRWMMWRIFIHSAATLFSSTGLSSRLKRAKELADVIVSSTLEMQKAIGS